MSKIVPQEIQLALEALAALEGEVEASEFERMKKTLPALAMQLSKAGEEITVQILKDHARLGEEHLATLKQQYGNIREEKPLLTYDGVIAELERIREEQERQKQEAIDKAL